MSEEESRINWEGVNAFQGIAFYCMYKHLPYPCFLPHINWTGPSQTYNTEEI